MSRARLLDLCQGLLIGLLAAGVAQAAAPMSAAKGKYFSGSGVCAPCHTNLKDEAGRDVSIDNAWRAELPIIVARQALSMDTSLPASSFRFV